MKTFKDIEEEKNQNENRDCSIKDEFETDEILEGPELSPENDVDCNKQYCLKIGTFDLVELILKDQNKLHKFLMIPSLQSALLPRFLMISITGFILYGLVLSLVFTATGYWPILESIPTLIENPTLDLWQFDSLDDSLGKIQPWINGNVLLLIFAYTFGVIAATGVCLPSLYFYGLLAGVRMTMVEVVTHAMKGTAVTSVALIGIIPIYVALAMGAAIFSPSPSLISTTLFLGLLLPFFGGMWGTVSLYRAFSMLSESIPTEDQNKRACFLNRLVFSWSVCYSAIMPVMVYTIWEKLA